MAGDTLFPKPPWDFTAGIKSRVFEISATEMNTINPKKKEQDELDGYYSTVYISLILTQLPSTSKNTKFLTWINKAPLTATSRRSAEGLPVRNQGFLYFL